MKIFDGHTHFHQTGYNSFDNQLYLEIFNSLENYRDFNAIFPDSANLAIILDVEHIQEVYKIIINDKRIKAIKLHSRIQKIDDNKFLKICSELEKIPSHYPIIYDGFYYGSNIQYQPSLLHLQCLLERFPSRNFVLAHSGGHKVLDFFFHFRSYTNLYYCLSLSLQLLEDSSCFRDIVKLIKWTDKKKILFGSDLPFASSEEQLRITLEIFDLLELSAKEREDILFRNALNLYTSKM